MSGGQLAGKVAFVTGAGSAGPGLGNGKAVARLFAAEGARVFACDINPAAAAQTQAEIEAEGGTCAIAQGDVSSAADVARMVSDCLACYGPINVLHNNVGIFRPGSVTDLSEEAWDLVITTNLRSLFLTCRHVIPVMERQGGGAIVNIGSISGQRFMGLPLIAYATSKGAVVSFTQALAAQYARAGIRANCVIPGVIDTPVMAIASDEAYSAQFGGGDVAAMHAARAAVIPMGRFGSGWDVARASLFLASDAASYITGTSLTVDGGLSTVAPTPPRHS